LFQFLSGVQSLWKIRENLDELRPAMIILSRLRRGSGYWPVFDLPAKTTRFSSKSATFAVAEQKSSRS
jgi:hypothetical protein